MRRIAMFLLLAAPVAAQNRPALRDYGRLPLVFEPNQGQADAQVQFLARTQGGTLFLTEREAVLASPGAEPVRMRLVHTGKPRSVQGLEPTGGISNYFIGNDPAKWRTNIPNYRRVEYKSVCAGVDLVYYGNPQKLEYDLVVAPGADVSAIRMEYEGVESLRVDDAGDLVLKTAGGQLRQKRPVAYQETASGRVEVKVGYRLKAGRRVAFELARYDAGRRLVIDPVLLYSTYLGGNSDSGYGIAVDGSGNAYVTGGTYSTNFPTTNPFQSSFGGLEDVFVTKLNATGSAEVYSTYLGGSNYDAGAAIAVDASGNAYVTGYTQSTNFPTVNPLQGSNHNTTGSGDAFVTKLNAAGSALVYSTYLGGSGGYTDSGEIPTGDNGYGIAVDGFGNAYVTGETYSTNFPLANPLETSNSGVAAFVTKINAAGSVLLFSTYLSASGGSSGSGIAVDGAGNAYVTGIAGASFLTANPLQASFGGMSDAFVTKINVDGSALVFSTYLGGSGLDEGRGIALDSTGNVYVTGVTSSTNFPTTKPFQASYGGGLHDGFVAKINAAGSALLYSTYLGGSDDDESYGIAVDSTGNAYVTGRTGSANFPTANPLQASCSGGGAFVTKINTLGTLTYSTCVGGASIGWGIALDGSGNAYVTGLNDNAFVLSISGNSATAAFRATSGAIELTLEVSTLLSSSGGAFAGDPAVAQDARGDTFVVARDASNAVWVNVFDAKTLTWDGWVSGGGAVQGVPAVTVFETTANIVARDQSNAYWTNTFTRGLGFTGWVNRGGAFATDPAIGGFYVVGKDSSNAIWTASWNTSSFSAWQLVGAVVAGKPSVTEGSDATGYIAIRDASNAVWMGRQIGLSFTGWQPGGGSIATDPQVATSSNVVYAAATTSTGAVWYNTFTEGAGNNWVGWVNAGGTLSSVTAAAGLGPQLFMAGRDASDQLWWFETPGAGWKFVGAAGLAAGPLSAAPR